MEDVENSLADFLKQLAEKESGPAKEKEQEPSHAFDEVFKPSHYVKDEKVETWDWFELGMTDDMFRGGLLWNIWKYTKRYRKKGNPLKDLGKASRYLDRLVRFESGARMEVIMREIEQEELGDTKVSDS